MSSLGETSQSTPETKNLSSVSCLNTISKRETKEKFDVHPRFRSEWKHSPLEFVTKQVRQKLKVVSITLDPFLFALKLKKGWLKIFDIFCFLIATQA